VHCLELERPTDCPSSPRLLGPVETGWVLLDVLLRGYPPEELRALRLPTELLKLAVDDLVPMRTVGAEVHILRILGVCTGGVRGSSAWQTAWVNKSKNAKNVADLVGQLRDLLSRLSAGGPDLETAEDAGERDETKSNCDGTREEAAEQAESAKASNLERARGIPLAAQVQRDLSAPWLEPSVARAGALEACALLLQFLAGLCECDGKNLGGGTVKQFARAGGMDVLVPLLRTLRCEEGVLAELRGGVGKGPGACRQEGGVSWGMACEYGERLWERVAGRYTLKKCGNIQVTFQIGSLIKGCDQGLCGAVELDQSTAFLLAENRS
jgi:hypothetical protein